MRKILLLSLGMMSAALVWAQELDFSVTVNAQQVANTDPKVFESLETAIQEFLNTTKWTNDVFEPEEKIQGTIILNVNEEVSATRFSGELIIQSIRPTFDSNYKTALLNYQDNNIWFDYEQFQPLVYSPSAFDNQLTALLTFYAFVAIGLDYDSFSPLSGEPYYLRAQEIVNNISPDLAGVSPQGWRSPDSRGKRNRYWMVENLLSPALRPYRQAIYDYHRQGMDLMSKDSNAGRAVVAEALKGVQQASRAYPNSMAIQMFSDAKGDEVIEIFKAGTIQQKNNVIQVMSRIDGARSAKYRQIR